MSQGTVINTGEALFAADASAAMAYRASPSAPTIELSADAEKLARRPLWSIAAECLRRRGVPVDEYGDRELFVEQAMQAGYAGQRQTFHSENEDRRYVQASGTPANRPGDFPNILANMANKFFDTIELDDEFSFDQVSALTPGVLKDMKPAMVGSVGVVDELDEIQDAESLKEIGLAEEVLSFIQVRRYGNKFGWTPVMIANDDMDTFAEKMIGLKEAWLVTQNRLVIDRLTSNETLLDGYALFANRPDVGGATNNNIRSGGGAPSDSEWGAMNELYSSIGGIETGRRMRGELNACLVPTGIPAQEARRTFLTLNSGGVESKVANTTANVGIYRDRVSVHPESELRSVSASTWYGLRNPTRINNATIVRGYFGGYGREGRREQWYDPNNKCVYISLEGRIGVAVKNWRYAVKNVT